MVNVKKLKAEMIMHDYTIEKMAKELGISPKTLSAHMKKGVFRTDHMQTMCKLLDIKKPADIFFISK